MIKLKPIAEQIIQESAETVTWGDVRQAFEAMQKAQRSGHIKDAAKTGGKLAVSLLPGGHWIVKAVEMHGNLSDMKDVAKSLFSISKTIGFQEMHNPKSSEFKKLTGPFWDAVRLTPEVSMLLDDEIETKFLNQVIFPELSKPGNDNDPIPNMDEELGKWLNDQGLKDKADIHFKGKTGDL